MRDKSGSKLKTAAAKLRSEVERRRKLQEGLRVPAAKFLQGYSDWCLRECRAECVRNFRLLGLVRNDQAASFLDYVWTLPSSEAREQFVVSLCKRSCYDAELSAEEKQAIEKYIKFGMPDVLHSSGEIASSVRMGPDQQALRERFYQRKITNQAVSKQLRKALRKASGSVLGKVIRDNNSALWLEKQVGSVYVVTAFEFGGWTQMKYLHTVFTSPGAEPGTSILSGISILRWMGIGESTWSWLIDDDVSGAAQSVINLCEHFFDEANLLLHGFGSS